MQEDLTLKAEAIAERVARNAGTISNLCFPHIYLGLQEVAGAKDAEIAAKDSTIAAEIDLNKRLLKMLSDAWDALRGKGVLNGGQSIADSIRKLPHADAQRQAGQEPVAKWYSVSGHAKTRFYEVHGYQLDDDVPLYTAAPPPAPVQPLTDEQYFRVIDSAKNSWNAKADEMNQWESLGYDEMMLLALHAFEAAHGIAQVEQPTTKETK